MWRSAEWSYFFSLFRVTNSRLCLQAQWLIRSLTGVWDVHLLDPQQWSCRVARHPDANNPPGEVLILIWCFTPHRSWDHHQWSKNYRVRIVVAGEKLTNVPSATRNFSKNHISLDIWIPTWMFVRTLATNVARALRIRRISRDTKSRVLHHPNTHVPSVV